MAEQVWLDSVETRIDILSKRFNVAEYQAFRLQFLYRVAARVADYAAEEPACRGYQVEIDGVLEKLKDAPQWKEEQTRAYYRQIGGIVRHLKKTHRLQEEGAVGALWLVGGFAGGIALGVVIHNLALGILIGAIIGAIIGFLLGWRARRQDRVI